MKFEPEDIRRNSIAKQLGGLLPQIDTNVSWVDYVPAKALSIGHSLIAIGMKDGRVKYVDIHKRDPFHLVGTVLNAMDDYNLEIQFLNAKQMKEIEHDLSVLATDRLEMAAKGLLMLEELSDEDKAEIVNAAIDYKIFPNFFPNKTQDTSVLAPLIEKFIVTNSATLVDTQILFNLICGKSEEKKKSCENVVEKESEEDGFELYSLL